MARLNQIQYRAAKLCTDALHLTSQSKLEKELAWESLADRVKFLGLGIFHKIHLYETRPLIRNCMPRISSNNTRSHGQYIIPSLNSTQYTKSVFPHFTKAWLNLENSMKTE